MTAGEGVKKAGERAKDVTSRTVDAVQDKINDLTDAIEGAFHRSGTKIHEAAGQPETDEKAPTKGRRWPGRRAASRLGCLLPRTDC